MGLSTSLGYYPSHSLQYHVYMLVLDILAKMAHGGARTKDTYIQQHCYTFDSVVDDLRRKKDQNLSITWSLHDSCKME